MMLFYTYSFACSVIGWVWAEILTQPGHIFNKLFNQIDKLPNWIAKPLGGCALCVTGQIALWTYLIVFSQYSSVGEYITLHSAKLLFQQTFFHVYFISLSILITWLLQKVQEKL